MKGMTIVKKSTCGFVLLIVFFILFGIYAVYSGAKISQSTDTVKEWSDYFTICSNLSDSLNNARLKASMFFITDDKAKQAKLLQELKESQADIDKNIGLADEWLNHHQFKTEADKEKV